MPTWAGQAVPSSRAWPRALPQPVSPHHQDGRQPAGRPPPGSARPGGGAPSSLFAPAPLCRDQAGKFPGGRGAQGAALRQSLRAPGAASHLPRAPRTPRRSAPAAARPSSGLARPHPALQLPPAPAVSSRSSGSPPRPDLAAGRPRARGPPEWGGLVTSAPRGRPWVPPPSRRSGASRADHSGQGAGRGPWASDVGLQALTSADPHTACQGRPATRRNTGGGAGPEILGPHR